jgi:Tfp pilus assembly protein PilF
MRAIVRLSTRLLLLLSGLAACAPASTGSPSLRLAGSDVVKPSFEQARDLIDHGRIPEAITVFRTLLREDGPSLPVLNGLAIAHAELGRPDLAAELFARALTIVPGDPATLNNIGYAALRRRDTALARRYLERAVLAGDQAPEIAGNLGVLARLEALATAPAAKGAWPRSSAAAGTLFAVQRETVLRVRLSGSPSAGRDRPPPVSGTVRTGSMLIDFEDLFDPYPSPPQSAGLIDFENLFDPFSDPLRAPASPS